MSSEYDKKNEPGQGQGQKDDKSMGGRQGQNPQGGREGEQENWREGQGGSQGQQGQQGQRKPSGGETVESEAE